MVEMMVSMWVVLLVGWRAQKLVVTKAARSVGKLVGMSVGWRARLMAEMTAAMKVGKLAEL